MEENVLPQGEVRIEYPFPSCPLGFALFTHAVNSYELCLVEVVTTQILLRIGIFETMAEVQEEYKHFVDTFAVSMRQIDWND